MYLDYLEWTWYILHMFFSSFSLCSSMVHLIKGSNVVLFYAIYDVSAYTDDGVQMHAKK